MKHGSEAPINKVTFKAPNYQAPDYQVPSHVCSEPFRCEEIIKGSRFIARVAYTPTVEEAKAFVKHFNLTEPDATHHCWAYIVGNPDSTTLLACSDDGEPSGTAGMPMLNVLKHGAIGDITAVVTRYYGGTKLGTGGLARAYGGSVKLALDQLSRQTRVYSSQYLFRCAYDLSSQVQYLLESVNAEIVSTDFASDVCITANIPDQELEKLFGLIESYQNKNQLEVTSP